MRRWKYRSAGDFGLPAGEGAQSLHREAGLPSLVSQRLWWGSVRAYLALAHRLTIHGRQHIPARPPYVLVANHASHLDVLALAAAVPVAVRHHAFPIAAGDTFFDTPAKSVFSMAALNALPMWRKRCGRHAMETLRERLVGEREVYMLFPEGTRSRDGSIGRFKPGIGMLVAGTSVPVVPCRIDGAFAALPPGRRVPRPRKLRVTIAPPQVFGEHEHARGGWNDVAAALQSAVDGAPQSHAT